MNKRNVGLWMAASLTLVLFGGLLLAGCAPEVMVGVLETESKSVELGDAKSVRVEINMGAGDLDVRGGAEKLLEADFVYNVARLKPEVQYSKGALVVRQPDTSGFPNLRSVTNFRNEWGLRLYDGVPMNLKVDMGAGSANLHLAGLSLTGLEVNAGAGEYIIDLSGDWPRDLDASIEAGAAEVTVRLPRDVGARVEVQSGPRTIRATGLTKAGDAYTNAAYGVSKVTLRVDLQVGVGQVNLEEVGSSAAAPAAPPAAQPIPNPPASGAATPQLLNPALGQKLQAALDAAVASPDTKWPGAVLHVRAPGLGAWSGAAGLGEVKTNTAMRPHDRFRAGSLTKPFISAVVLQLVEEGRFGLDDKIDKVLPAQIVREIPNTDRITVRMLLNHSSGIPDFYDLAGRDVLANPDKVWQVEEFLDYVAGREPDFAPGASQHYSNTNYLLLGLLIEAATGQTWREELRQRIFEPLGLKDTLLPGPEETALPGDHAHGYADFGQGPFDATELVTASVVGAAGGQTLITNAPDLARFMDALLTGKLFKKAGTLDQMLTFIDVPEGEFPPGHPLKPILRQYGLGMMKVALGNLAAVGHGGDTDGGYHMFVYRFPDQDITISGAVNTKDATAGYIHLMPRVLEVLVPGYKMQQPVTSEEAQAGAALQGLLDDQVKKQGILGMAMAVRMADGTVVSRDSGYIDPAKKNPWTADTVSHLASVTKTYTAVVIMQLVKEGKLSLDDTMDKWFPDQPNGDKITVRMLLSHTSGLSDYITPANQNSPKWTQEFPPMDALAIANQLGPVDAPGSRTAHYADTNYFVLGMIIEAVTGNSWEQAVRSRIIEPLDLKHTAFISDKDIWGTTLVEGYFKTPKGYVSILDIPNRPSASTAWANGGVVSSLSDLMTFASALFDGKLVSKETLAEMGTPIADDPDGVRAWGLGGATLKTIPGSFGMGGDAEAYHSFYAGIQGSKYIVVALVNTSEGEVIAPSMMALDYVRALPAGSQAPAQ